ncbi:MAG: Bax inhibitor-1/YccA family protein, partial [Alphaproteobacteria bacterium]|nr:Bax inhibitor-1/YccA family protein [Alphaproteobacteria bacterium]
MINFSKSHAANSKATTYDVGLREYMIRVFNYMCLALCITGVTSFATISTSIITLFYSQSGNGVGLSGLGWLFTLAPLFFVMFFSSKMQSVSTDKARLMLWVFSGLMGLSLAPIFLLYTGASIARIFFITASVFASMSIYGYTTKRDLTKFGSFLMMGLIGIIIASLVNIFMQSPAIYFVTSAIGVLIFTGLTAYDVQRIVHTYKILPAGRARDNAAVVGALSLYL